MGARSPGPSSAGRLPAAAPTPLELELGDVAIEAAQRAGAFLAAGRTSALHVETKSSTTDMVSEMDRGAEALVRSVVAHRRPGDAVLGEEGGEVAGSTSVRWIVDPLDGTTNFLYDYPAWCVSVAAELDGEVVAAAIFDPTHDELWTAVRGCGAARNRAPLAELADRADLTTALVATGFDYAPAHRAAQGRIAGELLGCVRDIRRSGSAALDLCWVAAGRVDAYFEDGTQLWDWAAGALIAAEAGAWVGTYDGRPPPGHGLLAAPPSLAAELRALLVSITDRPDPPGGASRT